MNKVELLGKLSENLDVTKADAERFLNSFATTIIDALKSGEKVQIPGFGSFEAVERAARQGINPATGQKIQIAAKTSPKFKAAKQFKDAL